MLLSPSSYSISFYQGEEVAVALEGILCNASVVVHKHEAFELSEKFECSTPVPVEGGRRYSLKPFSFEWDVVIKVFQGEGVIPSSSRVASPVSSSGSFGQGVFGGCSGPFSIILIVSVIVRMVRSVMARAGVGACDSAQEMGSGSRVF